MLALKSLRRPNEYTFHVTQFLLPGNYSSASLRETFGKQYVRQKSRFWLRRARKGGADQKASPSLSVFFENKLPGQASSSPATHVLMHRQWKT
jgi:hypothetical protein